MHLEGGWDANILYPDKFSYTGLSKYNRDFCRSLNVGFLSIGGPGEKQPINKSENCEVSIISRLTGSRPNL